MNFSEKLNYLIENQRRPDGKKIKLHQISKMTGLSVPYLSQLKTGVKTRPTLETRQLLANYFNVPESFFDDKKQEKRLESLIKDINIDKLLAKGSHNLDPVEIENLIHLIKVAKDLF